MTLKNALSGLPFGGGKAVIMAPPAGTDRIALLRAHGRFVNCARGQYITAEDVGTSVADMDVVALESQWVAGRSDTTGDPSPHTARGVVRAIEAAVSIAFRQTPISQLTIGVQGLGNVGMSLCDQLRTAGARVIGTDLSPARLRDAERLGVLTLEHADDLYDAEIDVFCPCGLGGALNADTIPRMRARVVVGAANNQLWDEGDANAIALRGIIYVPDFVANAGGVISGSAKVMGWTAEETRRQVDAIFDTTLKVLSEAATAGITADEAARRMARDILTAGTL
jgi:leucine dehydrogenase